MLTCLVLHSALSCLLVLLQFCLQVCEYDSHFSLLVVPMAVAVAAECCSSSPSAAFAAAGALTDDAVVTSATEVEEARPEIVFLNGGVGLSPSLMQFPINHDINKW